MEQTTLWAVAESQQNISNQTIEQAQPNVEPQAVAENANATWTSSWVEQSAQTQSAPVADTPAENTATSEPAQSTDSLDDLLAQVNNVINDGKTLEDVAKETEQAQQQKENEDALKAIVEEETKDIPSVADVEVKTDSVSSLEESSRLDEELKQGLEDIKDKKQAEDMAKKVYLAFQKERSLHQFDIEQRDNTIQVLKWMVKKLNEQVATSDNDPRITKLDDEMYTLHKLEQAYKKDKSETSRKNLTRYYAAKLATLNPVANVNKIMDVFNWQPLKSNTMWANVPMSAPIAEPKKEQVAPRWIPMSKRGMF